MLALLGLLGLLGTTAVWRLITAAPLYDPVTATRGTR